MTEKKRLSLYDFVPIFGLGLVLLAGLALKADPAKYINKAVTDFKSKTNITLLQPSRKNPIISQDTVEDTLTREPQNTLPTTCLPQSQPYSSE
jgi:hypothetical protein